MANRERRLAREVNKGERQRFKNRIEVGGWEQEKNVIIENKTKCQERLAEVKS